MRCRTVALGGLAATVYALVIRPRLLRWGATPEEVGAELPGDELLASADLVATRAISIGAAPADLWPWIAQLGQGRGGFYSYDALENLAGCDIHSAEQVVPEWQDVRAGDPFRLHPEMELSVARVEPGSALVVWSDRDGDGDGQAEMPYDFTWAFVIRAAPGAPTRLVVRERYRYDSRSAAVMMEPVMAVSTFMTQKMLRGIRERAERRHGGGGERRPLHSQPTMDRTP
jgi:hypothetical protein